MVPPSARLARFRLRFVALAVLVTGVTLAVVAPARPVQAAPTCSEVNAQLDKMWEQLEPLIEQYNKVHEQLRQNKAQQDALAKQIQPLQLQVDIALARVSSISEYLYKAGPASMLNAVLTSGSPTTLADQLSTLDQLAKGQNASIRSVAETVNTFNEKKKPLDALVAQQTQQDASLNAKKSVIEKQQADMQKLRMSACGVDANGSSLRLAACPAEYYADKGSKAAQFACNQIGKPYIWAAAGPSSYDCSGLTQAAWASVGVSLPHYTVWQKNQTTRVSRSQLRPGDLVFYFGDVHHVGIYVGGGYIVHAPQSNDVVRMARIDQMPVNSYGRPA